MQPYQDAGRVYYVADGQLEVWNEEKQGRIPRRFLPQMLHVR